LLRFWLPKSSDLSIYTPDDLAAIAYIVNHQPRRMFGWRTSAELYDQLAVH
jgi:IS30 family transposase